MMNYLKGLLALAAVLGIMLPGTASAAGTGAGIVIANTATATYGIGALTGLTQTSNTVNVTVQQVTDVVVAAVNSPITVNPGDQGRIASFRVTNAGNGTDTFTLAPNSTIALGDQFDPILTAPNSIAVDTNNNGVYDAGIDLYATATPALAADTYTTIFVFNNIDTYAANPAIVDGATGLTEVVATSQAASGAAGTRVVNGGTIIDPATGLNVDAISSGGSPATARATYTVSSVVVTVAKTSVIFSDPYGAVPPASIPGAVIRYSLSVTVAGTGTANGVIITDSIPANTTYVPGTIMLNAVNVPDATVVVLPATLAFTPPAIPAPGLVTVNLGNVAGGSPAQTITFDVKIN